MIDLSAFKKWPVSFLSRAKLPSSFMHMGSYRLAFIYTIIAVAAFQAAGICYKTLGIGLIVPKDSRLVKEEPLAIKVLAKEPADAYKAVLERNLFGSTDKAIGDKLAKAQEVPPLSSLIELRGTVAGEGKYGFAVLAEKGKNKQVLVKIGSQVAGATLLKVMRDNVVMRYMDKEEVLKRSGSTEAPLLAPGKGGAKPAGGAPGPAAPASGAVMLSRNELNASLKDMGQMLSQAQIRPYFSAGAPDGFIVSQIRQGSIFQKMGLQDGDIIQNLNDRKVQTADDMVTLFNTLRSAPDMNLTVKRSGKQEKMAYTFN
jgi:general secretion pathway protein C